MSDPGVVFIVCMLGLGMFMAAITVAVGYVMNPPRPGRWVPSRYPGRSPHWEPAVQWTPLLLRAALVGVATMFCLIPGLLLFSLGVAAGPRRRGILG